ncbi:MAG: hypothetical protein ABW154_02045, partial [Dyella sp.]
MELDDFKQAWQTLEQRVIAQQPLQQAWLRESKLRLVRRHLLGLGGAQVVQIVVGVLLIGWSLPFWPHHLNQPMVVVAGSAITLYGYALIGVGVLMLGRLGRIEPGAPVLVIQQKLLQLQRSYRRSRPWLGQPWWLLWIAVLVLAGAKAAPNGGAAIFALGLPSPAWLLLNLAIGVAGVLAVLGFKRWAARPGRERWQAYIRRSESPAIRTLQAQLDELERFERE